MKIENIRLDLETAEGLAAPLEAEAKSARETLEKGNGPGNDFLGWLSLPEKISDTDFKRLEDMAGLIRQSEALVVVGIGGSYLGARAVIEALRNPVDPGFPIFYAGHHLDGFYHRSLVDHLKTRKYSVNVISKSGTTTEPGLAFRFLWQDLKSRFSQEELRKLVFATTDAKKGSLRVLADAEKLETFVIPDDVGGRYSVFTPVGLLPIAVAGIDIRALIAGARSMAEHLRSEKANSLAGSVAMAYAAYRNGAYRSGKKIEIMASYIPSLHYISEWWKQLYGESEGKNGQGIFPASVNLSTDLHSLGQWVQEGERTIFETVVDVLGGDDLTILKDEANEDGLNYLAGRHLHDVNRVALQATREAHHSGDVPVARLELPKLDAEHLGALLYMFEYACGISAYMQKVNPFDQPGVEAYKNNMFRLLGKPGH